MKWSAELARSQWSGRRFALLAAAALAIAPLGAEAKGKKPGTDATEVPDKPIVPALVKAIDAGNLAKIRQLARIPAERDREVTSFDYGCYGCTAASVAAQKAKLDILRIILEAGGKPSCSSAVQSGNLEIVRLVLAHKVDCSGNVEFTKPIAHAAGRGDLAMVKLLLESGVKPLARHDSALGQAAAGGHIEVARALLAAGYPIDGEFETSFSTPPIDRHYATPLALAVARQQLEMVKFLLASKANPRAATLFTKIAMLHLAAKTTGEMTRLLLDAGADREARDSFERTPLFAAVLNPDIGPLKELLRAGADARATDRDGDTPFHLAASCSPDPERLSLLVKAGANPNALNKKRFTALTAFADSCNGKPAGMMALLAAGAVINPPGATSPLHQALLREDLVMARALLEEKADPAGELSTAMICSSTSWMGVSRTTHCDAKLGLLLLDHKGTLQYVDSTRFERTALIAAVQSGSVELVNRMLAMDPRLVNRPDAKGRTPLTYAASACLTDVVSALLAKGAKADLADEGGRLPVSYAESCPDRAKVMAAFGSGGAEVK